MTAKTKLHIRYSALIVLSILLFGYLASLTMDYSGMIFFGIMMLSMFYSIPVALLCFLLLYESKKWYNSILFLTSGMFNFLNMFISVAFIRAAVGMDTVIYALVCLPILLFILQLILFLKINKQESELE